MSACAKNRWMGDERLREEQMKWHERLREEQMKWHERLREEQMKWHERLREEQMMRQGYPRLSACMGRR